MYNICNYGYLGRRWSVFRELRITTESDVFSCIVRNGPVTGHLLHMMRLFFTNDSIFVLVY